VGYHEALSYGIIFWGASTTASKVFILQKKTLRIIYNIKPRDSCRKLFRDNQIMTFYSLYLYSLTLFVVKNKGFFDPNNTFHQYNTRTNKNLHLPSIHLRKYAKGPYVNGIKVFNHLPHNIKTLEHNPVKFKNALKNFFHQHPFYSIKEYFEQGNLTWGSFGQRDLLFWFLLFWLVFDLFLYSNELYIPIPISFVGS